MHLEREHNIGKEAAIRKIDTFLDELMRRQFPGGITIKDASKSWVNNLMNFSFKVRKSFIGLTLTGVICVNENSVVMDCNLPNLVKTFVSEDEIKTELNKQFDSLFSA